MDWCVCMFHNAGLPTLTHFFLGIFFACQRFVMYEGYPYNVPAMWKWLPKFLRQKSCATFIGCERTGLAYLTPNPHPKLAALQWHPDHECVDRESCHNSGWCWLVGCSMGFHLIIDLHKILYHYWCALRYAKLQKMLKLYTFCASFTHALDTADLLQLQWNLIIARTLGPWKWPCCIRFLIRPPPKKCYVALSRPTVKCEKTGSVFFFFLMSDLGEEFAKICIQWLKKALAWLVYAFWLHSARVFPI